jgi:hypothetical protein
MIELAIGIGIALLALRGLVLLLTETLAAGARRGGWPAARGAPVSSYDLNRWIAALESSRSEQDRDLVRRLIALREKGGYGAGLPGPPNPAAGEPLVYACLEEGQFHRGDCELRSAAAKPMLRAWALRERLKPCPRCQP